MNGHQLGSFEIRDILLEDGSEGTGELDGCMTFAFVTQLIYHHPALESPKWGLMDNI
jgi:hypothetical protein